MPGFLDARAPSVEAEYTRYLAGDVFGKIIFKNFCRHMLALPDEQIIIPLGRYGDVGAEKRPTADALVRLPDRTLDVEIKCARVNIANRARGDKRQNWAFQGLQTTPQGASKKYDLAFAIGVMTLGLEDPEYWPYLAAYRERLAEQGVAVRTDALPHEPQFLNICGFFIIPFAALAANYFRVTVATLDSNTYRAFFAWGHDTQRCRILWQNVTGAKTRTE